MSDPKLSVKLVRRNCMECSGGSPQMCYLVYVRWTALRSMRVLAVPAGSPASDDSGQVRRPTADSGKDARRERGTGRSAQHPDGIRDGRDLDRWLPSAGRDGGPKAETADVARGAAETAGPVTSRQGAERGGRRSVKVGSPPPFSVPFGTISADPRRPFRT